MCVCVCVCVCVCLSARRKRGRLMYNDPRIYPSLGNQPRKRTTVNSGQTICIYQSLPLPAGCGTRSGEMTDL